MGLWTEWDWRTMSAEGPQNSESESMRLEFSLQTPSLQALGSHRGFSSGQQLVHLFCKGLD